ncbi:hypothetical protein R5R35_014728 [Gryllus longicercus]|uniref:Short-chain dehydrogenase n=1 Tax=Gryllus longicercus TaxID=2509291 RepID=A0AAN9Z8S4_9ORTH
MGVWRAVGALVLNRWAVAAGCALLTFKIWYKSTVGVCTSKRRLNGRTVLITGANTGIGLETAKDLARRGARVLLACRDTQRGLQALEEVLSEAGDGATVALLALDLASLESVRACAKHVLATEPRLDILVNNAGAGGLGSGLSRDGLHLGLQVNHFGPFLFTLLLVELLKKSAPSRIIFVSSKAHVRAQTLSVEDLDHARAKEMSDFAIYPMTKLCNVLISNELARRLRGSGVTVNSLHPGVVLTDFFRFLPAWFFAIFGSIARLFFKNAVEGAQTTIYAAVAEELEDVTGRYFVDCKEARAARQARDEALARAVWARSEQLVRLRPDERPTFHA